MIIRNFKLKAAAAAAILVLLSGCSGDSEASKKRLLETGKKYFEQGKFKEASIVYRRIIQKDPRYGEAYYQLGLNELRAGRYADALRALRRASELQPNNDDAHGKLGDLYLTIYLADRTRYKQFLADFQELSERLLKKNANNYDGLRMRGYLHVANQNWKEAIADFRAATAMRNDQPGLHLALAQALASGGDRAESEKVARAGIEKHKTYGPLYDYLYVLKVGNKDLPGAEEVRKQKIASSPKSPEAVLELAAHYLRAGDKPKMEATLNQLTSNVKEFPKAHQLAGDFLFRTGQIEPAVAQYEAGIKANPGEKASLQKRIIELYAMQGRRDDAIRLNDELLKSHPKDAEAKALRASLRLRFGKREELDAAIAEFQGVLNQMPENPVLRFNLGEALMSKGDYDAARTQFQEAIKLRPAYVPPKLALARLHLARGEFSQVKQLTDEVRKINANLPAARILGAQALIGMKDRAAARTELEDLVAKQPGLADARQLLAMLDYSEGKLAQAEKGFEALYKATPPDLRGLLGLAEVYAVTKRYDQARQLLDQEAAKNPGAGRLIRGAQGNLAMQSGRVDDAIKIFEQLAKDVPDSLDILSRYGGALRVARRHEEALAVFQKAKALNPRSGAALLNVAMSFEALGRTDDLKNAYKELLRVIPDHGVALNNLAYILAESGQDLDEALSYAQRAKQQMPQNPDVADTLGWVYIKKNLSDDAIKIFRELVMKRPQHVTWRYHLALALFQKGDKLQARKELDTALKNSPNADETTKIKALMQRIG